MNMAGVMTSSDPDGVQPPASAVEQRPRNNSLCQAKRHGEPERQRTAGEAQDGEEGVEASLGDDATHQRGNAQEARKDASAQSEQVIGATHESRNDGDTTAFADGGRNCGRLCTAGQLGQTQGRTGQTPQAQNAK